MFAKIPQLTAGQASVQNISVGQLAIGPITVGQLVLDNASLSMSAVQATLQNLSVNVTLAISFTWHVHIGLPDGIPDINVGDTRNLGDLSFGVTVGNVLIPGLSNLHFQIPSLIASNVTATASPVALQLGHLSADQINVADLTLPSAGFTLAGLSLASLTGSGIGIPAANFGHATIGHVHGDPVAIPSLSIPSVELPSVSIPSISSSTPLSIPAVLPEDSVGFDAGILAVSINITPTVTMHIDQLQISGATASASTGNIVLHGVTLPYDALNLTLSQIGIETITIPTFALS